MKKVLAMLLVSLSIDAIALDAPSLITPSPLGVIIAVKSYFKDQKKVYYIRVESQARDFELAKKQAFRLASEQVAGTVVLSESESRNNHLTRDEITTYSSGLIDEYKIIDRINGPGYVKLTVDVWIAESIMAQRLLAKSATEQGINGSDLGTRAESILEERTRGDAILRAVLRDFPQRAFTVKVSQPLIQMDHYRNTRIAINWEINWDRRYFDAFADAAKQTGRKPCVLWGCSEGQKFFIQGWEFDDAQKLLMARDHIHGSGATVMVEIRDTNGRPVSRSCSNLGNLHPLFIVGHSHVALNTKDSIRGHSVINAGQNASIIATLENVHIEVVSNLQCRAV